MAYREHLPHPALRGFVDRFWTRSGGARCPLVILPDGCIDVLWDIETGSSFVVGAMTRAQAFVPSADLRIVAVRFRPGAAALFLGVGAAALTDAEADCAALGLHWCRVGSEDDLDSARHRLELALLRRLPALATTDRVIATTVERLFSADPPSIQQLAGEIGWSRQHLRRTFLSRVGLSPKQLARIARAQRAVTLIQEGSESLALAAASAGYFDEAHMDRDFRELIGLSPGTVRQSSGSIRPIPSLLEPVMKRS